MQNLLQEMGLALQLVQRSYFSEPPRTTVQPTMPDRNPSDPNPDDTDRSPDELDGSIWDDEPEAWKPPTEDWATPQDHRDKSHHWRVRSRKERRREDTLRAWFGDYLADSEIEKRQAPPKGIGDLMGGVMDKLDRVEHRLLRRLSENWDSLVGTEVAQHTVPAQVERHMLYVEVNNSMWMFRLRPQIPYLQQKIKAFTQDKISFIKLVPGGRTLNSGSQPAD